MVPDTSTDGSASVPKIGFVSLGCPKALVDSERILTKLRADGYGLSPDYAGADVVLGVQGPEPTALSGVRAGAWVVATLDPFRERARIDEYASLGLEALLNLTEKLADGTTRDVQIQ